MSEMFTRWVTRLLADLIISNFLSSVYKGKSSIICFSDGNGRSLLIFCLFGWNEKCNFKIWSKIDSLARRIELAIR